MKRCESLGQRYAFLKDSAYCRCSQQYNRQGTYTGCTAACEGDLDQICGGGSTVASLYELDTVTWKPPFGKYLNIYYLYKGYPV